MLRCVIVNKYKSDYDVDIMRGTVWGNPYLLTDPTDNAVRRECIALYKDHLKEQIRAGIITKDMLLELHGKRLGCCCKPRACHGDVLADLVNRLYERTNNRRLPEVM